MTTLSSNSAPSLSKVARGDLCAGCGGCAFLAPGAVEMRLTPPGYLRPHQSVPISDAQDAAIAAICPGLGQKVEAAGRKDDALWGPYLEMTIGHATDPATRYQGSSGGGLTAIMTHLVESGQVDAVIQTTAHDSIAIANAPVVNVAAADIRAAAGSRYAPSAPLADLQAYLDSGKRYVFVGKPCDAAALRALVDRDPALRAAIPVICSFFCAGVPSQTGGEAVLSALGTDLQHTASFRYRGNGWPGFATAVAHDGTEAQMSYHDSWGKILSRHVQHRCKICADGTGVAADIVCADAWESDDRGYPIFTEGDGTSLIVARTELGKTIIEATEAAGVIERTPFEVARLAGIQPGQRNRRRSLLARLWGLRVTGRPVPAYRGLRLREAAGQNSLKDNLKNFAGMVRRSLLRRA